MICDPGYYYRKARYDSRSIATSFRFELRRINSSKPTLTQITLWSDAAQQVTPATLKQMFVNLREKKVGDDCEYNQNGKLRMQIDEFDGKLLEILGTGMKVADKIGLLKKKKTHYTYRQNQRWKPNSWENDLSGEEKV